MSSSGSAATDAALQISPAASSPGTDASGTYSTRAASAGSVGSPTRTGSPPT
jgi:hypothetical protein